MLDCWSFDPKSRPTFKSLVQRVETVRGSKDGWAPPIPQPLTRLSWRTRVGRREAKKDEALLQQMIRIKREHYSQLLNLTTNVISDVCDNFLVTFCWAEASTLQQLLFTLQEEVFSLLLQVCSLWLEMMRRPCLLVEGRTVFDFLKEK